MAGRGSKRASANSRQVCSLKARDGLSLVPPKPATFRIPLVVTKKGSASFRTLVRISFFFYRLFCFLFVFSFFSFFVFVLVLFRFATARYRYIIVFFK